MDPLLDEIERFLALTKMKPTRFSLDAVGDAHFVRHLRIGRQYYPRTALKARQYMREYAEQARAGQAGGHGVPVSAAA
ncbi:hypothetical protein WP12_03960 [Sphingomonas sp. SRS2]|nr:hypothetical protein WP12_03960 [Sphingomonas sp. SRS2]